MQKPENNGSPTVLVVDDDDFFHLVIGNLLSILGVANVLVARNGCDGLKLLKTHRQQIDYLVCDIFMPDMDGIEFLANLTDLKYTGRILVTSGVSVVTLDIARTIATANGLRLAGAFIKPISLEQLSNALGISSPGSNQQYLK
jgi:CheY-like chemotaxis protein